MLKVAQHKTWIDDFYQIKQRQQEQKVIGKTVNSVLGAKRTLTGFYIIR